jgi:DNA polymerase-3 subunit delta'
VSATGAPAGGTAYAPAGGTAYAPVWRDIVGQEPVVALLSHAVADPAAMTHAWLFTGPPGSGRSNAARAFAAALQCPQGGCGTCRECRTALDGTHADVDVVATEGLSIKVEQARELVQLAALRPSVGRHRVILVEDADRLTERAADALLKALEEPAARTVWMLCAPSVEDVIITIRSRSRQVRLRTPSTEAVAGLLERRDGVDPAMARYAARAAQSHIGLARRLARDEHARIRRHDVLALATRIRGVGDAVDAAADLHTIATEESQAASAERDATERARLLEVLGADPGARTQPPHIRGQLSALEREQKARATRFVRDMIDRSLVDLFSIYRDALVVATGAGSALVNEDSRTIVEQLARSFSPERLLVAMESIGTARERIGANVSPLLALEAMALDLRLPH